MAGTDLTSPRVLTLLRHLNNNYTDSQHVRLSRCVPFVQLCWGGVASVAGVLARQVEECEHFVVCVLGVCLCRNVRDQQLSILP